MCKLKKSLYGLKQTLRVGLDDLSLLFTMKLNPNGFLARLKARLVAKGYSQVYDIDYQETFSLVTKLTYVHILSLWLSLVPGPFISWM